MESDRIDTLLEAYFDGTTNLEEEAFLLDYFNNHKVADHLLSYKPIFVGLAAARRESSTRDFKIETKRPSGIIKSWWYGVAALAVVSFGIGSFYLSQPQFSQEEKEALVAFENSKAALEMLSANFNKGAQQLILVDQFDHAKKKVWKENP